MKCCPKCGVNVEGLIERCDCCGASLKESKKRFLICAVYELPQCIHFSSLTYEMIDRLQPENPEKYQDSLEEIGIRMVCYPEAILTNGNIKSRVYYSKQKRCAGIIVVVDFKKFVCSDRDTKASLIATALLEGICSLEKRLQKSNVNIDEIIARATDLLKQYII